MVSVNAICGLCSFRFESADAGKLPRRPSHPSQQYCKGGPGSCYILIAQVEEACWHNCLCCLLTYHRRRRDEGAIAVVPAAVEGYTAIHNFRSLEGHQLRHRSLLVVFRIHLALEFRRHSCSDTVVRHWGRVLLEEVQIQQEGLQKMVHLAGLNPSVPAAGSTLPSAHSRRLWLDPASSLRRTVKDLDQS